MSTQNLLAGLLVAQLGLAALTWWPSSAPTTTATPLLPEGAEVVAFTIEAGPGEDANRVTLSRPDATSTAWVMDSAGGYPAAPTKVDEVLDTLADVTLRRVVATSATRHSALGVAAEDEAKRVVLTLADGTERGMTISPARAKAIHLRVDGEDTVYEVRGVSAYALRDTARSYWARSLFEVDPTQVTELTLAAGEAPITATRTAGQAAAAPGEPPTPPGDWTLAGLPADRTADGAVLDSVLSELTSVTLSEPVGTTPSAELDLTPASPAVSWVVQTPEGPRRQGFSVGAEIAGKLHLQLTNEGGANDGFVVQTVTTTLADALSKDLMALSVPAVVPDASALSEDEAPPSP